MKSLVSYIRVWHLTQKYVGDAEFITKCLELWDQGKDTKDISVALFQPEHVVEAATRLGRERRRQTEA
jgi:hypothetical protein